MCSFDLMLAKLIVHGEDRDAALQRMQAALAQCEIVGVMTNVGFLERMVVLGDFAKGNLDTGLIERNRGELLAEAGPHPNPLPRAGEGASSVTGDAAFDRALVVAAIAEWRAQAAATADASDPHSPWNATDAWWLNSASHRIVFDFDDAGGRHRVSLQPRRDGSVRVETARSACDVAAVHGDHGRLTPIVDGGDGRRTLGVDSDEGRLTFIIDGSRIRASVVAQAAARHVFGEGLRHRFTRVDPMTGDDAADDTGGHLRAPMSGTIVAVLVQAGDSVARGAPLIVLEAMKMEHTIVATADGQVTAVNCAVGERVAEGADLVDVEARA